MTFCLRYDFQVSLREQGLVVYAKVTKASRPVVDAKVTARIIPVSDQTETEVVMELSDNGAGDPDITRDDGIYSRYIDGVEKVGRHNLVVEVRSEGTAAILRSQPALGELDRKEAVVSAA